MSPKITSLFPILLMALAAVHLTGAATCPNVTSSSWPVDCSLRGYLITPDANNQTVLTTVIYNVVYNTSTSNATVWTSVRKMGFNSYWNSIRNVIWSKTTTISYKVNNVLAYLSAYSSQDCKFQAQFFASSMLTTSNGCTWGNLGDFVACGNVSSSYSLPVTTTMAPSGNCSGVTVPMNVSSVPVSTVTQSSASTATESSASESSATVSSDTSAPSNSSSSSNSSFSCSIVLSSSSIDCNLRSYLIMPDANNETVFTTEIYDVVYNNDTSNATVWTSARKMGFKSFWNSMNNEVYSSSSNMSTKVNSLVTYLSAYSAQDCEWQGQFLNSVQLEVNGGCSWGSLNDFVACGSVEGSYEQLEDTELKCVDGTLEVVFINGSSSGGGNSSGGVTVIGEDVSDVTEVITLNGDDVTGSSNLSVVTGSYNESFSDDFSVDQSNSSTVTYNSSTGCVTIAVYTGTASPVFASSTESSASSSPLSETSSSASSSSSSSSDSSYSPSSDSSSSTSSPASSSDSSSSDSTSATPDSSPSSSSDSSSSSSLSSSSSSDVSSSSTASASSTVSYVTICP